MEALASGPVLRVYWAKIIGFIYLEFSMQVACAKLNIYWPVMGN